MDPFNDFGLGGLANEIHSGYTRNTIFPATPDYGSGTSGSSTCEGSGGYVGSYRPSFLSRLGARIFGSSWPRISRATSGLLRLGCAAAGCYLGGHYTPSLLASISPDASITTSKVLVGAGVGGLLGYIALPLLRHYLPLLILFGIIGVASWFFLN